MNDPDPEPQWLTPVEREAWLRLTRVVIRLPSVIDAQLGQDAGVSLFEYSVLAMLSESRSRTYRAKDLARVVNSSATRLSNVLRRLEGRGLVDRSPDPDDGRGTLVHLTGIGMRLLVQVAPVHVEAVRASVFDQLSPGDVRALSATLGKILDSIDPDAATQPPPIEVGAGG